jgi:hypothetical protein
MVVDLNEDEIGTIIEALQAMFSEQPSTVLDDERELLARFKEMVAT